VSADGTKIILESSVWHARYRDGNGEWKRATGYTDKDATLAPQQAKSLSHFALCA